MKQFFALLLATVACSFVGAEEPAATAAERKRIAMERSQAEAAFAVEEKACYGRFAVNDCIDEARARRRGLLSGLRKQEIVLDDAERKQKSQERLREIEQRSSPENERAAAERRARAVADQQEREAESAEKAAKRATSTGGSTPLAGNAPSAQPRRKMQVGKPEKKEQTEARNIDAAAKARAHRERTDEAQARKDRIEKREAQRTKPASKPLPTPP